jgi:NitT/TauT family transport system substrate-binding protein
MNRLPSMSLAAIAIVLTFTGVDTANAAKVTLVLGQTTAASNEAFNVFVPLRLGYFKEEGIELEYQTSQGGTQAMQLVSAGQADVGLSSVPGVLLAREKGIPAVAVYDYLPGHATALATLRDGPIKQASDLKGKKIGIISMSSTRTFDGRAMVKAAGLDPDKDVEWLPVGFGAQAAAALTRGDVAALALWDATYVDIQNEGINLKFFTFPFQKDLIGFVYFTTDPKFKQRRDDLIKFFRATAKGTVFATASPEAATCAYLEETKGLEQARDRKKTFQNTLNVVKNNVENGARPPGVELWGAWGKEAWAVNQKYYRELGVVKGDVAPEQNFVGDETFYKAINDFDAEKIRKQAREYKCSLTL